VSERGFVSLDGARLWYERSPGTGPDVVLLHAGICDARSWEPQLDALGATHRVLRYDRRGFGRTTNDARTRATRRPRPAARRATDRAGARPLAAKIAAADAAGDLETVNRLEIEHWVVGRDRSAADVDARVIELCLDMNRIALEAIEAETIARGVRHAVERTIRGAAHLPHLERPDAVNPELLAFLREIPA